jgi:hypothetical protein
MTGSRYLAKWAASLSVGLGELGGLRVNSVNSGGPVRKALVTVVRGFLLGVGFCTALAATYFVVWQVKMNQTHAAIAEMGDAGQAAARDITVSNVEELKHDGLTSIIGSAKNTGKSPARSVQIQADLFNHGKFVDQYSTYISGTIGPGESKNFKISCGCKDSPSAEHDSYKIEVIGGY